MTSVVGNKIGQCLPALRDFASYAFDQAAPMSRDTPNLVRSCLALLSVSPALIIVSVLLSCLGIVGMEDAFSASSPTSPVPQSRNHPQGVGLAWFHRHQPFLCGSPLPRSLPFHPVLLFPLPCSRPTLHAALPNSRARLPQHLREFSKLHKLDFKTLLSINDKTEKAKRDKDSALRTG